MDGIFEASTVSWMTNNTSPTWGHLSVLETLLDFYFFLEPTVIPNPKKRNPTKNTHTAFPAKKISKHEFQCLDTLFSLMVFLGGLGRLVVWDSNRDTPKVANPFHFRGSNRNPKHQTPQTTKKTHWLILLPDGVFFWYSWSAFIQRATLGGGFKYFLFSPLLGEDSHFD